MNIKMEFITYLQVMKINIQVPKYKPVIKKNLRPIYRMGRVGCFIHKEDNENPVNLEKIQATGNPTLNKMEQNQRIDNLWFEPKTPIEDIFKYVLIGLGVVGVLFILGFLFLGNKQPPPVT